MWDVSKSPSINLANMGLLAKPNQDVVRTNEAPTPNENVNVIELFDIPDSDTLTKKEHPMKPDDQKYIAKCMAKYGDDYGKAFRDIKINVMQYTENQLRKMGARFLLLSPEQRRVEVSEKVKGLVDDKSDA